MSSSEEQEQEQEINDLIIIGTNINQNNNNINNNDIVVDLFNLNLKDDCEECMICKEELSCYSCYELPECKHKYHTHCLITWFRNGDSRCPYCGNKGINNINNNKQNNNFYCGYKKTNFYESNFINDLRKYAYNKKNEKNINAISLKKKFKKIKDMEKLYKELKKQNIEFKQKLKTQNVNFNETKKKLNNYRIQLWNLNRKINDEKYKLIKNSYIIPLIIPTTLDMT